MRALILGREVWRQRSKGLLRTVWRTWSLHRWRGLVTRTIDVFRHRPIDGFFRSGSGATTRERMRAENRRLDGGAPDLAEASAVQSVRVQLYSRWELCIAIDA